MDNEIRADDKWLEIEKEFWERNKNKTKALNSEYRPIYESLVAKLRTFAKAKHLDEYQYEDELRKAEEILDDIVYALKAYLEDSPSHRIWCYPKARWSGKPDNWTHSSPVDSASLDSATAKYLKNSWMQLNKIDWYIINAFVFSELAELSEGIVSGQVFGTINWAYAFASGRIDKTIIYQFIFSIVKFVLKWLLLPAFGILLYYLDFFKLAKWVFVVYAVYIVFQVILFPKRYFQRKERGKQYDKAQKIVESLTQIYLSSNVGVVNPTQLRVLMADAEKKGIPLRPAVYSILDRAIQRDPAVMAIDQ